MKRIVSNKLQSCVFRQAVFEFIISEVQRKTKKMPDTLKEGWLSQGSCDSY